MPLAQAETSWEISPETTNEIARLRREVAEKARVVLRRYYDDPVAFAEDCISWPEGEGLAPYQKDVLAAIPVHKRVAQRGPHGLGKSATSAIAVLWFAITRDAAGVGWKCATTAGGWHQLEHYLWPEIHYWAKRIRWERLGRGPFDERRELLTLNLNLTYGSAFAVASNHPARIEGAHADSIFYVFDEAKVIVPETFDAAEGAFSGAVKGTGREAFALASSTPGEPVGRFYDIHSHKKGFQDWWTRHVTLWEAIRAKRVDLDWARNRKRQWGKNSALWANRGLGEFFASEADVVIPLAWIEAAVERWYEKQEKVRGPMTELGIDVAGSGEGDETVFAPIHGNRVEALIRPYHEDTEEIADRAAAIAVQNPEVEITVDADGLGLGVYDKLNHKKGVKVRAFHAGGKTDKRDKSGVMGFVNVKAAAWWSMREALDPMEGSTMELPPDDLLIGDLSAPKWDDKREKGVISVEMKVDVKKRLGRSTDSGDAVVMGKWKERLRKKRRMMHAGVEPRAKVEEAA